MPGTRKPQSSAGPPTGGGEDLRAELARLYEAHAESIFRYFVRRGFSEHQSADMTHDVFIRVYKGLKDFRGESSHQTWIFQIARYHLANVLRTEKLRKELPLPTTAPDPGGGEPVPAHFEDEESPGILRALIEKQDLRRVRAAIDELPPRMRQCLLHRIKGRSYKEIATLAGCKVETVRAQLRQARERLRETFGGKP